MQLNVTFGFALWLNLDAADQLFHVYFSLLRISPSHRDFPGFQPIRSYDMGFFGGINPTGGPGRTS